MASETGLSDSGFRVDPGVPPLRFVLRAKDRRLAAPRFHNLQHIVGFLRGQRANQPFIQNQQVLLFVRFKHLFQRASAAGNAQLIQQFRHTDVLHLFETAAGCIAQGASNVSFAVAEAPLRIMWWPSSMYWQVANRSICALSSLRSSWYSMPSTVADGTAKRAFADKTVQLVALASVPFRIYQQAQPLLESQFIERGIFQLVGKFRGHSGHLHCCEHIHRCLVQHQRSPPFRK